MYKLTTQECKTGSLQWNVGDWHIASGDGELCSPAYLHAYPSALCAMFMNPIHARIQLPRLWKAEGLGTTREDNGLKIGYKQLRIVQELLPPIVTQEHRITMALLASLEVCGNNQWRAYAENYLRGNRITMTMARPYIEAGEEVECRTYAWKAALYEEVEVNSALAMQIAAQYRSIDTQAIFTEAAGTYIDTPADGRSRETTAFRSAPHD